MKRAAFLFTALLLLSGTGQAWWKDDYTLRKKITLDTSSAGGAISDPVGSSPVLIRLHDGDFQFAFAKDDGSDLRFVAGDDKTLLPYHIEKYDSLLGEAFVWVKVPDLKPGAATSFWLYYGNTGSKIAPGGADEKGTYDADTVLVYHFAQAAQPPHDSTGQGNNADKVGATSEGSYIGPGLKLDGKGAVSIPSSPSLAWTEGGALTWSAWVKEAALQANAVFFSRRDGAQDLLIGMDNGVPFAEIDGTRSSAGAPTTAGTWHHVAVVAEAGKLSLYLDGAVYGSLAAPLPALDKALVLGADASPVTGFNGEMDELEISRVARSPGFVKFAALGQGGESAAKLLTFAQDEQPPASWLSGSLGLFGVILKSVTIDGWMVIGVLGIMAIISWYVMFTKFFYLNAVAKGNGQFLQEWSHIASDLTVLDHGDTEKIKTLGGRVQSVGHRLMRSASLYKIYHIGAEEIGHRMSDPTRNSRVLSSQSIQAIRASLDGGFVRETQALNAGLVFLTISIAGGPFLGLLGTVVGVMITFAAIAATGEVNINAIAPGIAAALVATVAGLLVAIPALLGYNYLVSRIKTVTSDMQVFVDEFVTKMAEFYRPGVD